MDRRILELRKASAGLLKELTGVGSAQGLRLPKVRGNGGLPCWPDCHDAAGMFDKQWQELKVRHLYPLVGSDDHPNPWMVLSGIVCAVPSYFVGKQHGSATIGIAFWCALMVAIPLVVAAVARAVIRKGIRTEVARKHAEDDPIDLAHTSYLRQFALAVDETEKDLLGEKSPISQIRQKLDLRLKQAEKTRDRLSPGLSDEKYSGRSTSVRPAIDGMVRLIERIRRQQDRAAKHVSEIESVIGRYRQAIEDISPVLADRLAIYAAKNMEGETDRELADSAAGLDAALEMARRRIEELGRRKDYYLTKAVAAVHAAAGDDDGEHLGTMLDMAVKTLPNAGAAVGDRIERFVDDAGHSAGPNAVKA